MQKIYGVALGPGDPELITLKGLRILQESDVIFYPGSIHQGVKKSYVHSILEYHRLTDKETVGFYLEMSDNRTSAEKVYIDTAQKIEQAYTKGKKVAVVCEGDISLYASFSYILTILEERSLPVRLIPGVNSFSLGAAQHKVPLSLLNDKLVIIPRAKHIEEISHYFEKFDTIVLMKIRSGWKNFHQQILQKHWQCYYCERLGTEKEFITTDLTILENRVIPYFSLLIIRK